MILHSKVPEASLEGLGSACAHNRDEPGARYAAIGDSPKSSHWRERAADLGMNDMTPRPRDRPPEGFGAQLANDIIWRVSASAISVVPPRAPPEGPHFHYDAAPSLFLGRTGRGPLWVTWDTNLLIDYFNYGAMLWDGESLPEQLGQPGDELEGLQVLISLWVLRDIRFTIPQGVLDDSKSKPLSQQRRAQRLHAWQEFESALSLVDDGAVTEPSPLADVDELADRLQLVPPGNDRKSVEQAIRSGMHVFPDLRQGHPTSTSRLDDPWADDCHPSRVVRGVRCNWRSSLPFCLGVPLLADAGPTTGIAPHPGPFGATGLACLDRARQSGVAEIGTENRRSRPASRYKPMHQGRQRAARCGLPSAERPQPDPPDLRQYGGAGHLAVTGPSSY